MLKPDISAIDIGLLVAFDAVMQTSNVSRAAQMLGGTQSALSGQIAKLRGLLDDQLFVRQSHGVIATPFAQSLYPYVRQALDALGRGFASARQFDPETDERTFTIIMTDIGDSIVFPLMIRAFQHTSPNISFRAITKQTDNIPETLKDGIADLAITCIPILASGLYQRTLVTSDYICISGHSNRKIGNDMTLAKFEACDHVVAEARGIGNFFNIEQHFDTIGIHRNIKVRVPNFMSIPYIVGETDLIATVPRAFGVALKNGPHNIVGFEHPVDLPAIDIKMIWHERFHKDCAHMWLREQIFTRMSAVDWKGGISSFMGQPRHPGAAREDAVVQLAAARA